MKHAIIYGAGNIGRGFIGQLLYESGYEISFIDLNEDVIGKLNELAQYPIYVTQGDSFRRFTVKNVRGIMGYDRDTVADAIAKADFMATAVGVNALPYIAEPIANGIIRRMQDGNKQALNVIVCENMIGADKHLATLIKNHLDRDARAYFDSYVGLIEPSIGRMVPATPEEIRKKEPLAVCVEPYCILPVDRSAFRGEIPEIKNMLPFSPFDYHIHRKLYMHNMSHSLTAYLGARRGYSYIWQAIADGEIRATVAEALREISQALSKEYNVPISELLEFSDELLSRYENRLLGDTVERVGKDTKRKLSENDRFVGAIRLCEKHKLPCDHILIGIAAGLHFAPSGDSASAEVTSYLASNGIASALVQYCNLAQDSPLIPKIERLYTHLLDA